MLASAGDLRGCMYRGVVPFIVLEFVVLGLVALFPALALWLPEKVFGI